MFPIAGLSPPLCGTWKTGPSSGQTTPFLCVLLCRAQPVKLYKRALVAFLQPSGFIKTLSDPMLLRVGYSMASCAQTVFCSHPPMSTFTFAPLAKGTVCAYPLHMPQPSSAQKALLSVIPENPGPAFLAWSGSGLVELPRG